MSQHYPPPPLPPRYGNGSITAPNGVPTPYYPPPPPGPPPARHPLPNAGQPGHASYEFGHTPSQPAASPPSYGHYGTAQPTESPAQQYYNSHHRAYPPPPPAPPPSWPQHQHQNAPSTSPQPPVNPIQGPPQGSTTRPPQAYPPPPATQYGYPSQPTGYAPHAQASHYPQPQYAPPSLQSPLPHAQVSPQNPQLSAVTSSSPHQAGNSHQPHAPPVPPPSTRPPFTENGTATEYYAPPPPSQPPRTPYPHPQQAPVAQQQSYSQGARSSQPPPQAPYGINGTLPAAGPRDPLAGLTTQMNGLAVGPRAPTTAPAIPRAIDDESPRPPPLMRAKGPPDEVIAYCPEWRAVDYSLYWYHVPEAPEFFICTRCHEDNIKDTPLADRFRRIKRADHEITSCWFWIPRVKEIMWPQALRSGSMDSLRSFMRKRVTIKACKGQNLVAASEGIKWFNMARNDINGFVSCEACYEDRIVGGPFEHRFQAYQKQGEDEKWSCDVCIPFISRCIVRKAKQNNWTEFVTLASRRFQLPACEGNEVQSNSGTWYRTRRKIENLEVCETCYMDKLMLTRFEQHFERISRLNDLDSFIQAFTSLFRCKLTPLNLPMAFALENANEQRDWTVFQNAATTICRLPPCTANGIVRGNWWTLKGGCKEYDVCESCYAGIVQAGGLAQFFDVSRRNSAETFVCDFGAGSPRFAQYLDRFARALDTGVFSCYSDFVQTFASIPVCPGKQTRERTTWWGYREGLFCQDCYVSFVSKSALGKAVPLKATYDERPQICQIWSPRMRTMWLAVCNAGGPGSPESNKALAEFKAFMEKRLQIYVQTVPQMDMILAMKKMKMQSAMTQGMVSVMYNGMDGLLQASGATDGHLHGNSQIGWHATSQGAQGAQAFNNMQAGFMNANRVDEWMQMAQLETIWKQVE